MAITVNMRRTVAIIIVLLSILSLSGCAQKQDVDENETVSQSYRQISQEEAKEMMARDDGHVVVDVRRQDEYDAGHIPGAILVPNESIGCDSPEALPDYDQIILIYCRSGNRSKQAAEKLASMGYTNIYEFGGIIDWTGEIETEEAAAPAADTEAIEGTSDIASTEEKHMKLAIGDQEVPVTWEENASVDALRELLPLTIEMSMYGGFEQVGSIGQSIVRDDRQTTTDAGDIVLYSDNQIVVFYGSNSWAYTKLGHVNLSREEMTQLLGNGNVIITIR